MLRFVATFQRVAATRYLACWLRTTTSSPCPSPPKEKRETPPRPASTEMIVKSGESGHTPLARPGYVHRQAQPRSSLDLPARFRLQRLFQQRLLVQRGHLVPLQLHHHRPAAPAVRGLSDITDLYVKAFGKPPVSSRVFIRTRQVIDGWEDDPVQTTAIVPGR